MKYNKTILLILTLSLASHLAAEPSVSPDESDRVTMLQSAKNLVINTTDNHSYYYLVTSEQSRTMFRSNGQVVIGSDKFSVSDISSIRLQNLPRFSLNEDSTEINTDYAVNHGLLAFRRSFHLGQWNSLVVPFNLTGAQVREAFGEDAILARARAITGDAKAVLEFETIGLDTDDIVIEAGSHYLLRPTREPDIADGEQTSVAYGAIKVPGPLYVIPNVSLSTGQTMPANKVYRSDDDQLRLRFKGTYKLLDGRSKVYSSNHRLFALDDRGLFCELADSVAMKAFRSWIEEARNNNQQEVAFYIDGVSEDLTPVGVFAPLVSGIRQQADDDAYTLQGHKVDRSMLKPGIYIINRKKVVIK